MYVHACLTNRSVLRTLFTVLLIMVDFSAGEEEGCERRAMAEGCSHSWHSQ